MTLGQLITTLMIEQPIILCWKGNEDIEIRCTKTTAVPKCFENEQVNRIYIDDDKIDGYTVLIVELCEEEKDSFGRACANAAEILGKAVETFKAAKGYD